MIAQPAMGTKEVSSRRFIRGSARGVRQAWGSRIVEEIAFMYSWKRKSGNVGAQNRKWWVSIQVSSEILKKDSELRWNRKLLLRQNSSFKSLRALLTAKLRRNLCRITSRGVVKQRILGFSAEGFIRADTKYRSSVLKLTRKSQDWNGKPKNNPAAMQGRIWRTWTIRKPYGRTTGKHLITLFTMRLFKTQLIISEFLWKQDSSARRSFGN